MKTLISFIVTLICTVHLFAQVSQGFNYQAVLRNALGNIKSSVNANVRIDILQGSTTGTIVFAETFAAQTNAFGLINLEIGKGTKASGDFNTIDWSSGPYFITISVDGIAMGTSQLLSVPYAKYAERAGNAFSGDYNDLNNKPDFAKWEKDSTDNVTVTGNQTIAGNKTFTYTIQANAGLDLNNERITHVANPAHNADAVNLAYMLEKMFVLEKRLNTQIAGGTVSDYNGNIYNTVKIGNQVWMAENLKTIHYNNGDLIGTTAGDISGQTTPKYQWSYEGLQPNVDKYGRLYTYYAIMDIRGVCPVGWHIPSDAEWTTLTTYLGGVSVAGGKLKEIDITHWTTPNTAATNETGFTALPGGYRISNGTFDKVGNNGFWWSATEYSTEDAYYRDMGFNYSNVGRTSYFKEAGYSVRCVKD